jgi:hypothetical protein
MGTCCCNECKDIAYITLKNELDKIIEETNKKLEKDETFSPLLILTELMEKLGRL